MDFPGRAKTGSGSSRPRQQANIGQQPDQQFQQPMPDYMGDPYLDEVSAFQEQPASKKKGKGLFSSSKKGKGGKKKEPKAQTTSERVRSLTRLCGFAAVIAIIGIGVGIWGVTTGKAIESNATKNPMTIVVASEDIARGELITEAKLKSQSVPESYRSSDAISWDDRSFLVGQPATASVAKGSQLTSASVVGTENKSSLSQVLHKGYEAITISVGDESGFSHLAKIGDMVRIAVLVEEPGVEGARRTVTLATVPIIALGNSIYDVDEPDYSSITVEVTPEQANFIREGQKQGETVCMLESYASSNPEATGTVSNEPPQQQQQANQQQQPSQQQQQQTNR